MENGGALAGTPSFHHVSGTDLGLIFFSKKKTLSFSFLTCSADRKNAPFILPSNLTETAYESMHCKTRLEVFCPMLK